MMYVKAIVADTSPFIVKGGWFPSREILKPVLHLKVMPISHNCVIEKHEYLSFALIGLTHVHGICSHCFQTL